MKRLIVGVSYIVDSSENEEKKENKSWRDSIQYIEDEATIATNCDEKKVKEAYIYSIVDIQQNGITSKREMK